MNSKIQLNRVPYRVYYHKLAATLDERQVKELQAALLAEDGAGLHSADRSRLLAQIDLLLGDLDLGDWSLAQISVEVEPGELATSRLEAVAAALSRLELHLERSIGDWVREAAPPEELLGGGSGGVGNMPVRSGGSAVQIIGGGGSASGGGVAQTTGLGRVNVFPGSLLYLASGGAGSWPASTKVGETSPED